jgi:hypothetical protein
MNNNMKLIQLSHCKVNFCITQIAYHTLFNFTKSTCASGTGRRSTIARHRASGSRSTSRGVREVESQGQIEEVAEVLSSPRTPI